MATFVLILDRSLAAARILYDVLHDVVEYETISVDKKDVHKNTALAWMRLHGVVAVYHQMAVKFKEELSRRIAEQSEQLLHQPSLVDIATESGFHSLRRTADTIISGFVEAYPDDKDVIVFREAAQKIRKELKDN